MELTNQALTTLARVREDFTSGVLDGGIPPDGRLVPIIESVSEAMAEFCNRLFAYEVDRAETVWARHSTFLRLKRAPVLSVSDVSLLDIDGNVVLTVDDSEIFEDGKAGLLFRRNLWTGSSFYRDRTFDRTDSRNRIRITYTGGYVTPVQETASPPLPRTLPFNIEELCIQEVTRAWRSRLRDTDVDSRSTADTTVTYRESRGLTRQTMDRLKRYWLGDV